MDHEMPRPNAAHERLEKLAGSWTAREKLYPSPWGEEGTATGRVENRVALDGFVVIQEYEQERGGKVVFRGHGVLQWDARRESYVLYWFDSMGMPPNEFRGTFEGEVLTMTDESPPMGITRIRFDLGEKDAYGFRMEHSRDGREWAPLLEATYTRAG